MDALLWAVAIGLAVALLYYLLLACFSPRRGAPVSGSTVYDDESLELHTVSGRGFLHVSARGAQARQAAAMLGEGWRPRSVNACAPRPLNAERPAGEFDGARDVTPARKARARLKARAGRR